MQDTGSCFTRTDVWDFRDQLIAFFFLSLSQNRLSVAGICNLLKSVNTCQKVMEVQVRYVGLESFLGLIPIHKSGSRALRFLLSHLRSAVGEEHIPGWLLTLALGDTLL